MAGKRPGVTTREIDLTRSKARTNAVRGIPAGLIGTSTQGPAFVPITFSSFQDFITFFGDTDGERFGPLAVKEWMRNATAGAFVRLLGVGDGKKRSATDGAVANGGFIVGQQLPQSGGLVGSNSYTETDAPGSGTLGRTFFLGCFMSESAGSTIFSDAGIQTYSKNVAHPIIRGVLFTPSGVVASLSSSQVTNNNPPTHVAGNIFGPGYMAGANLGDVITGSAGQDFVMILNGHKSTTDYPNAITASFDPTAAVGGSAASARYFARVFNTDPLLIEPAGHYLYAHYDIHPSLAVITGSGVGVSDGRGGLAPGPEGNRATLAFMLTGSMNRATSAASDSSNVGVPDFESFTDRFTTAKSPFVISQQLRGKNRNLFRVIARSDGNVLGDQGVEAAFKITIANVQAAESEKVNKFGKFDLLVRRFNDSDEEPDIKERFNGLDLDPSSDRYIARVIGDRRSFYDFDRKEGSQKLVVEGDYPNNSALICVEVSSDLRNDRLDDTAIPVGFRGLPHLVTSGTATDGSTTLAIILTGSFPTEAIANTVGITPDELARCVQPPVPFRESVANRENKPAESNRAKVGLTWGVQFEVKDVLGESNRNRSLDPSLISFVKHFPDFHTTNQNPIVSDNEGVVDLAGCVLDADRFNNNFFTLERVEAMTGSDNRPDPQNWSAARYRRNGALVGTLTDTAGQIGKGSRFLDPAKDFLPNVRSRNWLRFTFPIHGGFSGLNIFDKNKFKMTDTAARREMNDTSNESGVRSATVASIRKAIDVIEEKSDIDIQLLAIPGLRHTIITDYAIEAVERRFDALFIMDIEEKDTSNIFVTSSVQNADLSNTITQFRDRALDSSFAAAYFPDVVITDPSTRTNVQCPPSVAVLGAFALNDKIGHPWFAPAGFARGVLRSVLQTQFKLEESDLDDLYAVDINSIVARSHSPGAVIFGQKTLLATQTALDRINVRRLLINIRRVVRNVVNTLLFEPNRAQTLASFSAAVDPLLAKIQQQRGLTRYKIQIDTSTTTREDVQNNTIRGKIFLQPTRSGEFVSLDFTAGLENF